MKFIVLATLLLSFTQAFGANVGIENGLYTCTSDQTDGGQSPKVFFDIKDTGLVLTLSPLGALEYTFSDDWQDSPVVGVYQARRFSNLVIVKNEIDDSNLENGDITYGQSLLRKTSEGFYFEWSMKIISTESNDNTIDVAFSGKCTL